MGLFKLVKVLEKELQPAMVRHSSKALLKVLRLLGEALRRALNTLYEVRQAVFLRLEKEFSLVSRVSEKASAVPSKGRSRHTFKAIKNLKRREEMQ